MDAEPIEVEHDHERLESSNSDDYLELPGNHTISRGHH